MEDKLLLSKAVGERLASLVPRDTHVECVELTILGLCMSKDIITLFSLALKVGLQLAVGGCCVSHDFVSLDTQVLELFYFYSLLLPCSLLSSPSCSLLHFYSTRIVAV